MTAVDQGAVLRALDHATARLLERALTVFLEYDFLDYSVLEGASTGGHVLTYLSREADRMADVLLAASGRPVPPPDRGRRWEIEEGGHLRPGAVLIDDLHVSAERLGSVLAVVEDWAVVSPGLRSIPERRLLQVLVHHADLERGWDAVAEEDAAIAVPSLKDVLGAELEGFRIEIEPAAALTASPSGVDTLVAGAPKSLLAWATGRVFGLGHSIEGVRRPTPREWI